MKRGDLWERLTVPVAYLVAGLVGVLAYGAFGWVGLAAVGVLGVAYQVWWRWRHGRWMTDADWMVDDS